MTIRDRLGEYEIFGQWARGARSEVYVGRSTASDDLAAVKVLGVRHSSKALLELLEREAPPKTEPHPQVAVRRDVFLDEGRVCIASEFVEGEPLRQLLRAEKGGLGQVLAISIAAEIARVVEVWHDQQLTNLAPSRVHGDLSTSTVMLTYDGRVVLRDFGVALAETRVAREKGAVLGHVAYMSPERLRGVKHLDARADVYSVGLMLWEMLTGVAAIAGEDERALRAAAEKPRVEKPSTRVKCTKLLDKVLMGAIAVDPEGRPKTMNDLLVALDPLLQKVSGDPRVELERRIGRHFVHRARAVRTLEARWKSRVPSKIGPVARRPGPASGSFEPLRAQPIPSVTSRHVIPAAVEARTTFDRAAEPALAPPRSRTSADRPRRAEPARPASAPTDAVVDSLPIAAFTSELGLDGVATEDLRAFATSDFPMRPPVSLSFTQGVFVCVFLALALSASAWFWPPEWRRMAVEIARDVSIPLERALERAATFADDAARR